MLHHYFVYIAIPTYSKFSRNFFFFSDSSIKSRLLENKTDYMSVLYPLYGLAEYMYDIIFKVLNINQ